jgi:hypothetical protein
MSDALDRYAAKGDFTREECINLVARHPEDFALSEVGHREEIARLTAALEEAKREAQSAEAKGYARGVEEAAHHLETMPVFSERDRRARSLGAMEVRSLLPRPDAEPVATTTEKEGTDE